MKRDIDKIVEEVLASLAIEDLKVSNEQVEETKEEHKKLVLRKEVKDDGRR